MREAATTIADEAALWVARLDREGDSASLRAQMRAWADADDRRAGALLRAEACWTMLNKAVVLGVEDGTVSAEAGGEAWSQHGRRRWWIGGAAFTAAAALLVVFSPLVNGSSVQQIETAMGEIRRVPLADGSLAAVNTDSRVEVALLPEQRHVVLARGEAWFQVAKDTQRPFLVEAGDVRVRAVGTAFSVYKQDDGVDVRVTEGVVEVWRVGEESKKRRISAGAQMMMSEAGVAAVTASAEPIERALSWRDGQLIFDGDSVAEAAEQFNRYNAVKIEIASPDLRDEKMIGRFRTNEPQAFARAAAAILHAKVDVQGDRIILSLH